MKTVKLWGNAMRMSDTMGMAYVVIAERRPEFACVGVSWPWWTDHVLLLSVN